MAVLLSLSVCDNTPSSFLLSSKEVTAETISLGSGLISKRWLVCEGYFSRKNKVSRSSDTRWAFARDKATISFGWSRFGVAVGHRDNVSATELLTPSIHSA
jgi:hypothetical protein